MGHPLDIQLDINIYQSKAQKANSLTIWRMFHGTSLPRGRIRNYDTLSCNRHKDIKRIGFCHRHCGKGYNCASPWKKNRMGKWCVNKGEEIYKMLTSGIGWVGSAVTLPVKKETRLAEWMLNRPDDSLIGSAAFRFRVWQRPCKGMD